MNKEIKKAIKTLKTYLGMETKLEDMPLADGMTTIQADMFEVGEAVFIVGPEGTEPVPLPVGEYELADGRILVVEVEGVIAAINEIAEETETVEPTEVPVEAEKVAPQTTTAKKIVKTTTEEQHFSRLELKIEELKAEILALSKVDEIVEVVKEVVELEEIKPIKHNPENKSVNNKPLTPLERFRDIKSRMNG
ncbi:hypothetical protein UFOVP622_23 [uncultured Caudovirales phage]|uniref:Uncharacterized protein n=1 Tax=uncultured Caudovirales phage TaxID=2100421 RepID=A0A6J5N3T0_9CAUD|nr:hypothetical protein UFOVP622_23 [uncultured Caudovirales phage]